MEEVTDAAFRYMIAKTAKPDVMFTEFTSADALCSVGKDKVLINFRYDEIERPIVAQIFGSTPKNFYHAAKIIADLGFDGIDINMGCPDETICKKQKAGAALIKNPKLAQEIIHQTMKGAPNLPVSVKTRLGYSENIVETWLPALLETGLAAVIIHGRTKKEMSKVPAHWDAIARASQIRHERHSHTLIIGNGDIASLDQAKAYAQRYDVDGIMLGRAIFGNPWLFTGENATVSFEKKVETMMEHAQLYDRWLSGQKSFLPMRKHFGAYMKGFKGAKELRSNLVLTSSYEEAKRVIDEFFSKDVGNT